MGCSSTRTGTCLTRLCSGPPGRFPPGPSAAGGPRVTVMTPTPAPNAAWTPGTCRGAWECPCLGIIVAELQRSLCKPLVGILECTSGLEPGARPPAPREAAASACRAGSLTRHMLLFTAASAPYFAEGTLLGPWVTAFLKAHLIQRLLQCHGNGILFLCKFCHSE